MEVVCSYFNIVNSAASSKCQQPLVKWNSCSAANTYLTLKTPLKLNTKLEMGTYRSRFHKLLGKHRPFYINDTLSKSLSGQATRRQGAYQSVTSCPF